MNDLPNWTMIPFGDRTALVRFEETIAPAVNDQVTALHDAIRSSNIAAIEFMVPAFCSLTIGFDSLQIDYQTLHQQVQQCAASALSRRRSTLETIEIPVCYDECFGVDLAQAAIDTQLSIDEIITLHTQPDYRVYMLGFLPGFAYLGTVHENIQLARLATPRLKVPQGAVGIAGGQTGVYPVEAPGGWRIIGRTPTSMLGNDRTSFLLKPGNHVRFRPIRLDEFQSIERSLQNEEQR